MPEISSQSDVGRQFDLAFESISAFGPILTWPPNPLLLEFVARHHSEIERHLAGRQVRNVFGLLSSWAGFVCLFCLNQQLPTERMRLTVPILPVMLLAALCYFSLRGLRELRFRRGVFAAYKVAQSAKDRSLVRAALKGYLSIAPARTRGLRLLLRALSLESDHSNANLEQTEFLSKFKKKALWFARFNPGVARVASDELRDFQA